jgi:hypothetical protein
MAKKKAKKAAAAKPASAKRHRRTDEELISDLKTKIRDLRVRQESRKLKESPSVKATLAAIKWLDKALEATASEGDAHLRHALADARKPLETHLTKTGVRLPKARLPRGRRPKETAS